MPHNQSNQWAIILGGSSGFGLAAAKELARTGMNVCVLHRDRRGSMSRIEVEFDEIKKTGVDFKSFNIDALNAERRGEVLTELSESIGKGNIRVLLHSIAFGSLKLIAPLKKLGTNPIGELASKLGRTEEETQKAIDELFTSGAISLNTITTAPAYEDELLLEEEEILMTINAMGTSLLSWTRDIFKRELFCKDARILGLTSEGNEVAWLGYAAVSAAKASLESISRSIAREYGPHGIRCNVLQPGVTKTPALELIPGSAQLSARAELRNPLGRLTEVEDVAKVIAFLSSDAASWINGTIIRVDGGEHISGA